MLILRFVLLLGAVMSLAVSLSEKMLSPAAINYAHLPLSFEANQGQAPRAIKFLARGNGYQLALTATEAVLQLWKAQSDSALVKMKLVKANPAALVAGRAPLPGKSNYFIGNDPAKWRTDVPHYAKVEYEQVWPGVNAVYYGNQQQMEYDFIVAPGADPRAIKLAFEGAEQVTVNAQGELVLRVAGGEVAMHKPVVYQEVNGARQEIAGGYVVEGEQARFHLGEYDTSLPLVIDPVLSYSTYLGGGNTERGIGVAVDSTGKIYLTGQTLSTDFPRTVGPSGLKGGLDFFVTKLDPAKTGADSLMYSTYLGGSRDDACIDIAVDAQGRAYVGGSTQSSDFPVAGSADPYRGQTDVFVLRLNAAGSALEYSTYLGDISDELLGGLALDTAGNAYVTGTTSGTQSFPRTVALGFGIPNRADSFITKFNAAGARVYSAVFFGNASTQLYFRDIAVDSTGNAYVTGYASSAFFPDSQRVGPVPVDGLGSHVLVTKLNAAGTALAYFTFLGGTAGAASARQAIAVDAASNAYLTGATGATNFPVVNPAQATPGGQGDAFVAKFNVAGNALLYATYLGGSGQEGFRGGGAGIAVDAQGSAYVTGDTDSMNFPNPNAVQPTVGGGTSDAFVTKLSPNGSTFVYSTYLGGSGIELGNAIALDRAGNAYVAGTTVSTNFPTRNAYQPNNRGGIEAFVAQIADGTGCPALAAFADGTAAAQTDTLTLSNALPPANDLVSGATLKIGGLKVTASYRLESREDALLIARLFDQAGNIRGDAGSLAIKKATSCTPTLPSQEFVFPRASLDLTPAIGGVEVTSLTLSVLMVDARDSSIIRRADVNYRVIPDAVAFDSSPKINGQDAPDGSQLPAEGKVNFDCGVPYHLTNDLSGQIRLQAINAAGGAVIATKFIGPVTATPKETRLGEVLNFQFTVPAGVNTVAITVSLLADNQAILKSGVPLFYRYVNLRIQLGEQPFREPFREFGPTRSLVSGKDLMLGDLALKVSDDLPTGLEQAKYEVLLRRRLNDGSFIGAPQRVLAVKEDNFPRPSFILALGGLTLFGGNAGFVPDDADKLEFQLRVFPPNDGLVIASEVKSISINRIRLLSANPATDSRLIAGTRQEFVFSLAYNTTPAATLRAAVTATLAGGKKETRFLDFDNGRKPAGASSKAENFRFSHDLPPKLFVLEVHFELIDFQTVSSKTKAYSKIEAPPITINAGVKQTFSGLGVDLTTIENAANRLVKSGRSANDAKNAVQEGIGLLKPRPLQAPVEQATTAYALTAAAAPTAVSFKDFVGVNATWQFDPPIAANSGFIADLKFYYRDEDLPDDPNFNEAAMKVIGFDPATGRLETYPTTLDLQAKTATARVNGLLPLYSLGIFGPFAQRSMHFPVLRNLDDFNTRLTFASVGNSAATLTTGAYDSTGQLYTAPNIVNPLTMALATGRTLTGLTSDLFKFPSFVDGGWLQTRVNKNFVAGYQMLGKDDRLDVLGAPAFYVGTQVLTDVSFDATRTTEIHLANVTRFDNAVTLEWRSATGALLASYETMLAPKESLAARVQDLFTSITQPFAGYVIVRGTHDLTAAALSVDTNEIAALPGQVVLASNTATKLYAPYVVHGSETITRLNLLNPTTSAANLTLRLVNKNSAIQTALVRLTLAAGQQSQRDLAQIFNLNGNASFYYALIVESSISGIVADVSYRDPADEFAFRASLPLTNEAALNFAFAHLDNRQEAFTEISVFNPQPQAASVTLKVFKADGSPTGTATFNVPAGGLYADLVDSIVEASFGQQGGYFTLSSNQPVLTGAAFGTLSSTMLAALPAQAYDATAFTRANATVSAASYQGPMVAAESIVAAFGNALATGAAPASSVPLPLSLAGTSISVQDSLGINRLAPLFFISPGQINYLIPTGTALGAATVTITSGDGTNSTGTIELAKVAPGLFTANANGLGVAAAVALRVKANGAQSFETIARFDTATQRFVSTPIDLGPTGEQVFLLLFGTGLRGRSSLAATTAIIGGAKAEVSYAGAQGDLVGLDQVNMAVPRNLAGRGELDLVLTVDGRAANTVRVNIK